jgi:hypothetical protein
MAISVSRGSMWESAMREGETWAESDGHLRISAAKPAALPIRNSRRRICVPNGTVQDFRRRSAKQGQKTKKKRLQGQAASQHSSQLCYLRLFIRRSRTSAYGSCGLFFVTAIQVTSRAAAGLLRPERTFTPLFTPMQSVPVSTSGQLATRILLISRGLLDDRDRCI